MGINSIFVDFFRVNKGCERFQIHASPLEGFSVMIFQSTSTLFSLTFSESTRLRALPNPRITFRRCFGDDFPVSTYFVFIAFFLS
jgi:hypothetical protein